ncbi:MAG: prephenate dehydrogenase [Dehalococcoidia bacterium]|nr:MAG: prephenate dehydrogenase [Dehalococcoidia bacterium]
MKVAIIGGSGKMGSWFARFFLKEDKDVLLVGRSSQKLENIKQQLDVSVTTSMEDTKQADIILISVPVDNFEETVKKLSPYTHPDQTILDITSVKTLPVEAMHKYIVRGRILGTHPVFGPGARSLANQNFVLTPTNEQEKELAEEINSYLEIKGARVHLMTPLEHDDMMAIILGLAHFIAIASADSLANLERMKEMESVGGITYKVLLTLVESVISEDPELYASLQMNLPNLTHFQKRFLQSCENWAELVKQKDRQQFISHMKAIRQKLETKNPNFGKSYDNMYKIAENL